MSFILLDNSTYFSFKRLIEESHVDADTLYNAANFVECLVAADDVALSPTTAWAPGSQDILFSEPSPVCVQLDVGRYEEEALAGIFLRALGQSRQTLTSRGLRKELDVSKKVAMSAIRLLDDWQSEVQRGPVEFLSIYSGAVFRTDPASSEVVEKFSSGVRPEDPPTRHIAQYLLRTNAALEFAANATKGSIPYHPHSHRASYVVSRLESSADQVSGTLATFLIREAEAEIEEQLSFLRDKSALSVLGGFQELGVDAPLVLSVALGASSSAADVVPRVLEIRQTKEAQRFRGWTDRFVEAARTGTFEQQKKAERELGEAREVLSLELRKLHGARNSRLVERTAGVATAFDPEDIADANLRKLGFSAIKEALGGAPTMRDLLQRLSLKRKMAFLLSLAKQQDPKKQFSGEVERIFGKSLDEPEQAKLGELSERHRMTLARLRREGPASKTD